MSLQPQPSLQSVTPPSAESVREAFVYDPESGVFFHRQEPSSAGNRTPMGRPVGSKGGRGYIYMWLSGRLYQAHRLVWLYVYGEWPDVDIDHRDTDRTNNRIANLRVASRRQNNWNANIRTDNTTGVKGVSFDKARGKWCAYVNIDGKRKSLGRFETLDEAAAVRKVAAQRIHSEFYRSGEQVKITPRGLTKLAKIIPSHVN